MTEICKTMRISCSSKPCASILVTDRYHKCHVPNLSIGQFNCRKNQSVLQSRLIVHSRRRRLWVPKFIPTLYKQHPRASMCLPAEVTSTVSFLYSAFNGPFGAWMEKVCVSGWRGCQTITTDPCSRCKVNCDHWLRENTVTAGGYTATLPGFIIELLKDSSSNWLCWLPSLILHAETRPSCPLYNTPRGCGELRETDHWYFKPTRDTSVTYRQFFSTFRSALLHSWDLQPS